MTRLDKIRSAFIHTFKGGSAMLKFTFNTPFTAKQDGSEQLRVHVTKAGEVTYRPFPMSVSRSVVGLTIVADNSKQGATIVSLIQYRSQANAN